MSPAELEIIDAVCAGCSCLCDDILVRMRGDELLAAEQACEFGHRWFTPRPTESGPACLIDGKAASLDEAFSHAARLLAKSRAPLISGLSEVSTECQQQAAGIADVIGATIDGSFQANHHGATIAMQQVGKSAATFGEVRDRADLVVVWRANLENALPRLIEQLRLRSRGSLFLDSATEREIVVIDSIENESSLSFSHQTITLDSGSDLNALRLLRAMATDVDYDAGDDSARTGVAEPQWRVLFEKMKAANYVAILYGGEISGGVVSHATYEALFELARDLHPHSRCVCLPAYHCRNAISAREVLAWRTGYPAAVNLGQGYPQYAPGESDAAVVLQRHEADAVVALVDRPDLTDASDGGPPVIWFTDQPFGNDASQVEVAIRIARPGFTVAETFSRNDGVALTTQGVGKSAHPALSVVLQKLGSLIRKRTVSP